MINANWPGSIPSTAIESLKMLGGNLVLFAIIGGIVLNAGSRRLSWLRNRLLVYLGTISYGIYLYHHIIFKTWDTLATHYGCTESLLIDSLKVIVSITLAIVSWHLVERPFLTLKEWFRYQPLTLSGSIENPSMTAELGTIKLR